MPQISMLQLRLLSTTARNYSPTILNQRNWLKSQITHLTSGEWLLKTLRTDDEPL
jgi:hypothetical protein